MPWAMKARGRVAVTAGFFWRRDPAAALRGLAKTCSSARPAASRSTLAVRRASLKSWKAPTGK